MICSNCGSKLADESIFCNKCGNKISNELNKEISNDNNVSNTVKKLDLPKDKSSNKVNADKSTSKKDAIIMIFILLIAAPFIYKWIFGEYKMANVSIDLVENQTIFVITNDNEFDIRNMNITFDSKYSYKLNLLNAKQTVEIQTNEFTQGTKRFNNFNEKIKKIYIDYKDNGEYHASSFSYEKNDN